MKWNGPLCALTCFQMIIYIDRGLLPGCTLDVTSFLKEGLGIRNPNFFFATIQSSFIGGLMVASMLFAYAYHYYTARALIYATMILWIFGELISGLSAYMGSISHIILLLARIISGFGEGALISLTPPLIIQLSSKENIGYWIGTFCAILPLGMSLGFLIGGSISAFAGWNTNFFFMAGLTAPILLAISLLPEYWKIPKSTASHDKPLLDQDCSPTKHLSLIYSTPIESLDEQNEDLTNHEPEYAEMNWSQLWHDLRRVIYTPSFIYLAVSSAAYSTVVIAFSTFGASLLLGLQFFDKEILATYVMGGIVAFTGIFGGLAGGLVTSFATTSSKTLMVSNQNDSKAMLVDIKNLALYMMILTMTGTVCMILISFVSSAVSFLILLTAGLFFIIMTQSNLSLCIMLIVPKKLRSLSVALNTVFLHIFGDVPGTIIIGLIKDKAAPHCSSLQPGTNQVYPECHKESYGLRLTIFIISVWLVLMILGFLLTHCEARYRLKKYTQNLTDSSQTQF